MAGDADHDGGTHHDANGRPADGAQGRRTGAKGIGSQHRQRAQHHPETVLDVGNLHDGNGQGQSNRTADGIAEPHGAERQVEASRPQYALEDSSPTAPSIWSVTGWAPAASSAASATRAVAMPSIRASKLGSRVVVIQSSGLFVSAPASLSAAATGAPAPRSIVRRHFGVENTVDHAVETLDRVLYRLDQ